MQNKKKIAIFIDWFLPGYKAGGPITSVANIISHLKDDFEFYVVTSDKDLGDTVAFDNLKLNSWLNQNGFKVIYLTPENQTKTKYRQIFAENSFDFVYFNSLFSVKFALLPLIIAKKFFKKNNIILAPRGMLGKGAIELKSVKKRIFFLGTKILRLFNGITWHSTNIQESTDINNVFGKKQKIIIASNLPISPTNFVTKKKDETLKLFFYSRISRKKNLDFALNVVKEIKSKNKIIFDIIGPIEDQEYWENCKKIITELPNNIIVRYIGIIRPTDVIEKLRDYQFLFLPTKHENFGHVIFEAFAACCPVIVSTNTPWCQLEQKEIGWDIDLNDRQKFIDVISECVNLSQEDYNQMSKKAFNFAQEFANNPELIEQTKKLFE